MGQTQTTRPAGILLRWGVGFMLATLISWGIGAVFVSDVLVWHDDGVTGRWLPEADRPYTYTREGWGTTTWQAHARLAEQLPRDDEPTVVFWGDSYVEARQVDDREKMFNVFTRLTEEDGTDVRGVGVALSGWGLGDYYELLPKLRGRLGQPVRHVFVVQLKDLLPRHVDGEHVGPMGITPPHTPGFVAMRRWFYRLELSAFWSLPRDAVATVRTMRFRPGPAHSEFAPVCECAPIVDELQDTWTSMVADLQARADAPIAFVLLPDVPQIRRGRVVVDEDTSAAVRFYNAFVDTCRQQSIPCIDMAQPFIDAYRRTGRFPRGFANTRPSEGHLNAHGQRLVAEAIAAWLRAQEDAP
jgi:hypothetical protein